MDELDVLQEMTIDTSGTWWTSSDPGDIRGFLEAYSSDGGYPIDEFTLSRCSCGSTDFQLDADDTEGCAKRMCKACSEEHYICDSEEYWEDAEPEHWTCIECKKDTCNVGAGFALYPDSRDIKWIYIGCRCPTCGILGCFAGWKVGYGDSQHLIAKA